MLTSVVLRVEHFKSSKTGNPVHVAWFMGDKGLPVKTFCPDFVEEGSAYDISVVPDFRCNASFEFAPHEWPDQKN